MIIRIPIIPGYTDSEENIMGIVKFAKELKTLEEVNLLPYHRFGKSKYKRLGRNYKLQELQPPNESYMQKLKGLVESFGLRAQIGG